MPADRNSYVKNWRVIRMTKNALYINLKYAFNMWVFTGRLNLLFVICTAFQSPPQNNDLGTMEADILRFVNEDRKQHNLPMLQINDRESSLAEKHSTNMADGKTKFGHDGFEKRAKTIQKELGSVEVGENVAEGQMTAREVVDGWLNSPGHKRNIEGNFTLTGIGYAVNKKGIIYFTEIFSR
jgi:uncharacterized protein YkwD